MNKLHYLIGVHCVILFYKNASNFLVITISVCTFLAEENKCLLFPKIGSWFSAVLLTLEILTNGCLGVFSVDIVYLAVTVRL